MRKDHRISWIFSVVKMNGLEPSTPCMSSRYSNQLSYTFIENGGDEGIRTLDFLHAKQALSQLSYAPVLHTGPSYISLFLPVNVDYYIMFPGVCKDFF